MKINLSSAAGFMFIVSVSLTAGLSVSEAVANNAPEKTRMPTLKNKADTVQPAANKEKKENLLIAELNAVESVSRISLYTAEGNILVAQTTPSANENAQTEKTEPSTKTSDTDAEKAAEKEDDDMSKETVVEKSEEEQAAFRQTMHEGDVALGVCGARVSALMWFYEASINQGREDLKAAAASLKESREKLKIEAERRAVEDGVDTSVRVMNSESEKIWKNLNDKASGDTEEFQKAHDDLFAGVQECLALFFEKPESGKDG